MGAHGGRPRAHVGPYGSIWSWARAALGQCGPMLAYMNSYLCMCIHMCTYIYIYIYIYIQSLRAFRRGDCWTQPAQHRSKYNPETNSEIISEATPGTILNRNRHYSRDQSTNHTKEAFWGQQGQVVAAAVIQLRLVRAWQCMIP